MLSQKKAGCVECCVHARVHTFYLTGRAVFMIMRACDMLCESYSLSGTFVVQCLRQTFVILNDSLPAALFKRFHVVKHLFISWNVHTKSKTFEHICVTVAPLDMCQINILFVSWSDNRLYCRQCAVSHQPQPPLLGLGDVTGRVNVYILNCKYGLLFRHLICCFHCMTISVSLPGPRCSCWQSAFLGAFAELRKASISFVMSQSLFVRPSVSNNSGSTGRIFFKFDI